MWAPKDDNVLDLQNYLVHRRLHTPKMMALNLSNQLVPFFHSILHYIYAPHLGRLDPWNWWIDQVTYEILPFVISPQIWVGPCSPNSQVSLLLL